MSVYEVVSAERKTEMLSHLLMLSRTRLRERPGAESDVRRTLSPDLITNIRQFGYRSEERRVGKEC